MVAVMPEFARLFLWVPASIEGVASGDLYDADIVEDLLQATSLVMQVKSEGWSVSKWLGQGQLVDTGVSQEAMEIVRFFAENMRSPSAMTEFLTQYDAALRGYGNPKQGGMFGPEPPPSKSEVLSSAKKRAAVERLGAEDRPEPGAKSLLRNRHIFPAVESCGSFSSIG